MTQPNVVVVGASAAGALTAKLLARSGLEVTLLDASPNPAGEARTLIVTEQLRYVVDSHLAEACTRGHVERFELRADGSLGSIRLIRPDLVIERADLIEGLLIEAENAGAEILRGHRFVGFYEEAEIILSSERGETCRGADVVVGADGAQSRVARAVGVRHSQVSLVQALVARPADLAAATARVWFRPNDTPYFFWMIPDGDAEVAVGLIAEEAGRARAALDGFLLAHDLEPRQYQAARVPEYRRWVPLHRRWGHRSVYLVGDAAAQVKVSTVGGVVTGLKGARAVAAAILSGRAGRTAAELRWELGVHGLVRRALHGLDERAYAELVSNMAGRLGRALSDTSRDAASAMLARSIWASPRIGLIGLRGLVRSGFG